MPPPCRGWLGSPCRFTFHERSLGESNALPYGSPGVQAPFAAMTASSNELPAGEAGKSLRSTAPSGTRRSRSAHPSVPLAFQTRPAARAGSRSKVATTFESCN